MVKTGDKIKILEMKDEPQYTDKMGIVEYIDDMGQLHGTWGGLAVIPEDDKFIVLEKAPNKRVIQISLDIVVDSDIDGTKLAEDVAKELGEIPFEVVGAGFKEDVTEFYKESVYNRM